MSLILLKKKLFDNYSFSNKEDKVQFKKALDQASTTIKKIKQNYYSFTFKNVSGFFLRR